MRSQDSAESHLSDIHDGPANIRNKGLLIEAKIFMETVCVPNTEHSLKELRTMVPANPVQPLSSIELIDASAIHCGPCDCPVLRI